ncbi:hypothetical protein BCR33DRAFT_854779 [Rhizoclosmatium globosum]|uniref:Uncharacterized protein n=1 Tax=Rhizoclosmatium globosum TaxID=329046 RepID=A0A1Y2BR04_9FUNG|nr:hypothetical protein BCR33DRAFT_854779 [Rhizoclosmatium globosum]|eukprot:ORY37178.1 hypothetical protein BCR33DRAFT_854779 [Rhizoclosmatium globosum]
MTEQASGSTARINKKSSGEPKPNNLKLEENAYPAQSLAAEEVHDIPTTTMTSQTSDDFVKPVEPLTANEPKVFTSTDIVEEPKELIAAEPVEPFEVAQTAPKPLPLASSPAKIVSQVSEYSELARNTRIPPLTPSIPSYWSLLVRYDTRMFRMTDETPAKFLYSLCKNEFMGLTIPGNNPTGRDLMKDVIGIVRKSGLMIFNLSTQTDTQKVIETSLNNLRESKLWNKERHRLELDGYKVVVSYECQNAASSGITNVGMFEQVMPSKNDFDSAFESATRIPRKRNRSYSLNAPPSTPRKKRSSENTPFSEIRIKQQSPSLRYVKK